MMKTLYISDLDGTLLRNDQSVSDFTAKTVEKLLKKGLQFSYATARSYATASKVTSNLHPRLPVIVFNGTFIIEPQTQNRVVSNTFSREEADLILDALIDENIFPIVNAFFDGNEKFSYVPGKETRGIMTFLNQRRGDPRAHPVSEQSALYEGDIFHIACIDEEEKLRPAYDRFRNIFPCVLYKDVYSNETWLELHPKGATKADAIVTLKNMLHCDKLICFGDGKNDVSMFEIADECYAVSNAESELKEIATAVIESNECDGVAKWLANNANKEEFT